MHLSTPTLHLWVPAWLCSWFEDVWFSSNGLWSHFMWSFCGSSWTFRLLTMPASFSLARLHKMRTFHLTSRENLELSSPCFQGKLSFPFLINKYISKLSKSIVKVPQEKATWRETMLLRKTRSREGGTFQWEGLSRGPSGAEGLI